MARKRLVELYNAGKKNYNAGKRNYEICLILHQRLSEDELNKKLVVIKSIIEAEIPKDSINILRNFDSFGSSDFSSNKGEIVDIVSTKIRSFCYPIQNNSNLKGYYICVYAKIDPVIVSIIRNKLSLESDVLRVLVVLANPKKQSYGVFSNQYETDAYKNKNKFYSYDDPNTLSRFLGERAKIAEKKATIGKKTSKNQSKTQRAVAKVIKTSRFLSLLPYQED